VTSLALSFLKSYWPQLAAFVGAVALGFGVAWNLQGLKLDALDIEFGKYRNQVEQQAIEARRLVLDKENFWRTEAENARINAQAREARIKAELADAKSAGARLRDSIATLRTQLADAPGYACLNAVATLGELLETCRGRYEELGQNADGHVSDIKEMRDRWPK